MQELTAKEIADDVQQTFNNVSNKYRQILEGRIKEYSKTKVIKVMEAFKRAMKNTITLIAKDKSELEIDKMTDEIDKELANPTFSK